MHAVLGSLLVLTSAPAASALLQDAPGGELVDLAFRPAVGLALERNYETKHDLVTEAILNSVGNQMLSKPGTMRLQGIHKLQVIDHFRAMDGGRPTNLRRTFLASTRDSRMTLRDMEGAESPTPLKQAGPFEKGLSVVFEWSPEEGDYGKHYDARESEEEHLIGLTENLDLDILLPGRPVAVGTTWTVAPALLRDLFAAGGTIPYDVPRKADSRLLRNLGVGLASGLEHAFAGSQDGEFSVTLRETREVEGRHEAVLVLAADFKVSTDQVDYLQKQLGPIERAAGMVFKIATLVLEFRGGGELVWDLDGGFARSLSLDLEERAKQYLVHDIQQDDRTESRIQDMRMAGKMTIQMSANPVEPPPVPGPH